MTWGGTPGPWKADRNHGCRRITAKRAGQLRQVKRTELACTSGLYDDAEDQANANGMAAVPVMIEALLALRFNVAPGVNRDRIESALKAAGVKL